MIGNVLRTARVDADLTQQQVATNLGISVWTYNRLEKGHRKFEDKWIALLPRPMRAKVVDFLRETYEGQLARLASINPKYQFARRASIPAAA